MVTRQIIRNTTELSQTDTNTNSNKKLTNGGYDYPIFRNTKPQSEDTYLGYQHIAQVNKKIKSNYHMNPGLFKGKAFKPSIEVNSILSPEDKLLSVDFNKKKYGSNRLYKDDIKEILKSGTMDKYDRIKELLREEMWNRSRIKNRKANYYYTPTLNYDTYLGNYKGYKQGNMTSINQPIPSAKDLLLPKLPLIKQMTGKMSMNTNTPFVTNLNDEFEGNGTGDRLEIHNTNPNHKNTLSMNEPRVNNMTSKQRDTKLVDVRDMKIRAAIQSFTYRDKDNNGHM